jgi:peptidoglycan/LPS O-acetylase OafA/YrhL
MLSSAEMLLYLIFGSAVLLTGKLAIAGVYPLAAIIALALLAYGYLARWGGRSIEERLFAPPRRP